MWYPIVTATLYAIAMAYLEATIVLYLRRLYYPEGFGFPLVIIDMPTLWLEIGRETATMVMLATFGLAAGRTKVGKLAYFLLLFGVWDIFYYVWLKVFLNWPDSLLTWDVLFLIPVPWVGPVLAPVTVALTMIGMALVMLQLEQRGPVLPAGWFCWTAQNIACVLIIMSFTMDVIPRLPDHGTLLAQWIPTSYRWWMFNLGEMLALGTFIPWMCRAYQHTPRPSEASPEGWPSVSPL